MSLFNRYTSVQTNVKNNKTEVRVITTQAKNKTSLHNNARVDKSIQDKRKIQTKKGKENCKQAYFYK